MLHCPRKTLLGFTHFLEQHKPTQRHTPPFVVNTVYLDIDEITNSKVSLQNNSTLDRMHIVTEDTESTNERIIIMIREERVTPAYDGRRIPRSSDLHWHSDNTTTHRFIK